MPGRDPYRRDHWDDEDGPEGRFDGPPDYGPGPGLRQQRDRRDASSDPGRRADYRTDHGLTREDREAIGGPYTDYGRTFGGYGAGGGYVPNPDEGVGREGRSWRGRDDPGSWFGRPYAEKAHPFGPHRGRGPKGYTRSGERIREDVSDRLMEDPHLDASDIEVSITGTEVTLAGTVESRTDKRRAEDHAEEVTGVTHVQNNLRVRPRPGTVGAQTNPVIAAVSDGKDADQQALELREERDARSAPPPR